MIPRPSYLSSENQNYYENKEMNQLNEKMMEGMTILLGYMDGFDKLGAHHLLFPEHDVFDKVDRNIIIWR